MRRRTVLVALVTAGFVVLTVLPAVVTFAAGWLRLPQLQPVGAPPAKDPSTPEAWVVFAVVYLVWMAGLMVLLVWTMDHIGHQWQPWERETRPKKKQRRRARATARALAAEQQATVEAMRRREQRDAARRRDRERDEALRRGADGQDPGRRS